MNLNLERYRLDYDSEVYPSLDGGIPKKLQEAILNISSNAEFYLYSLKRCFVAFGIPANNEDKLRGIEGALFIIKNPRFDLG